MALLQVFIFFDLTERSRENMTKFYILIFVENAVLLGCWWPNRKLDIQDMYNEICLSSIIASFGLSLVFMFAFYLKWHPSVNNSKKSEDVESGVVTVEQVHLQAQLQLTVYV